MTVTIITKTVDLITNLTDISIKSYEKVTIKINDVIVIDDKKFNDILSPYFIDHKLVSENTVNRVYETTDIVSGYINNTYHKIKHNEMIETYLFVLDNSDEFKIPNSTESYLIAAKFGKFNVLKWLHKSGNEWHNDTFSNATEFGDLSIIKWLYENHCPIGSATLTNAVKYASTSNKVNRYGIIKLLDDNKCPTYPEVMMHVATEYGHLNIMKYLYDEYINKYSDKIGKDRETMIYAIKKGNIENIEWLASKGYMICGTCFRYAIEHSSLDVMKCLKNVGCDWSSDIAPLGTIGCPEKVEWLKQNNYPQ
jgi:hypothetical protein